LKKQLKTEIKITEMKIRDYDEALRLWKKSEGVGFHKQSDCKKGIGKTLVVKVLPKDSAV
jgi:hypothetical protein